MTVIATVISALRTVTKGLYIDLEDMEVRGQGEAIQTTAIFKSTRVRGRVQETWGDLLSLGLQLKAIN